MRRLASLVDGDRQAVLEDVETSFSITVTPESGRPVTIVAFHLPDGAQKTGDDALWHAVA